MCDCIKLSNDALKERGLELDTRISFSVTTGAMKVVLPIQTKKLDPKNRKAQITFIAANYCPFCGEKMEQLKEE